MFLKKSSILTSVAFENRFRHHSPSGPRFDPKLLLGLLAIFILLAGPLPSYSLAYQQWLQSGQINQTVQSSDLPDLPQSISGKKDKFIFVTLGLAVDSTGRLLDTLVLEATHAALIDPILKTIPKWTFLPLKKDGVDSGWVRLVSIRYYTSSRTSAVSLETPFGSPPPDLPPTPVRFFNLADLNEPPVCQTPLNPEYPSALTENGAFGKARVTFFIDEFGKPRLPALIKASYPEMGDAAIEAITRSNWEPGKVNGQPVTTKMTWDFNFSPPN